MGAKRIVGLHAAAGLVGMGVASLGLMAATAGASTPQPVVKVKPNSGLSATATVKVKGSSLGDDKALAIMECNAGDSSPSDAGCNVAGITAVQSSSTGTMKAAFGVLENYVGADGPVNCAPGADQCIIVVTNERNLKELGEVPISFAS